MKDLMNQINKDTEDLKEMLEYKRYTITLRDKEGNEIVETVDAKNIMHATQRAIEGHEDYFPVSYKEHES